MTTRSRLIFLNNLNASHFLASMSFAISLCIDAPCLLPCLLNLSNLHNLTWPIECSKNRIMRSVGLKLRRTSSENLVTRV